MISFVFRLAARRHVSGDGAPSRHGWGAPLSDAAEHVKRPLKLVGQMETEAAHYHLMVLLLSLQGEAFNPISHDDVLQRRSQRMTRQQPQRGG